MDNQYKFIKRTAFPTEKVEETRKVITEQWDGFASLGISDLGFLLQKQKDTPLPTWWLENKDIFLSLIIMAYSMSFLDNDQVVISLRRGEDVIIDINDINSLKDPKELTKLISQRCQSQNYGFPRRILTFGKIDIDRVTLILGSKINLDVNEPNDFSYEDYITPINLKEEGFDAKTEIKEDFERITATISELVYPSTVRDVNKMADQFHALEEHCYDELYQSYKTNLMSGRLLVEQIPTLCFVHELAYYDGQIVDSYAMRFVMGQAKKCDCGKPNCGTLHIEHDQVNLSDPMTVRYVVLDNGNGSVISQGVVLQ